MPRGLGSQFSESLPPGWREKLRGEASEPYFEALMKFLRSEHLHGKQIVPAPENVLRAMQTVDLPDVKVVILGQDPYHGPDQAIGFSFAVPNVHFPKPPSLQNILKELQSDLGITLPRGESDLTGWAQQGVLLLNTLLTVEVANPLSHRDRGWEKFTDRIIRELSARRDPMVFILWGSHAQKMKALIDTDRHAILQSAHPSPLSAYRGFLGSKVFSKTNALLKSFGKEPIHWERLTTSPGSPPQ